LGGTLPDSLVRTLLEEYKPCPSSGQQQQVRSNLDRPQEQPDDAGVDAVLRAANGVLRRYDETIELRRHYADSAVNGVDMTDGNVVGMSSRSSRWTMLRRGPDADMSRSRLRHKRK
jgi:hypothetical protein